MHAELPACCHYDAIRNIGYVYCACDLAGDDDRRGYGAEVEGGEGRIGFCRGAEIDDAVSEVGDCWRACIVRGRREGYAGVRFMGESGCRRILLGGVVLLGWWSCLFQP
jgi:hypothetical protein